MRRSIQGLWMAAALVLGGGVLASGPARACGMYEPPIKGEPTELLVRAYDEVEKGEMYVAGRVVRAVASSEKATDAQKAEAWAIQGWLRWRQEAKESARASFAEARKLEPAALDAALDRLAKIDVPTVAASSGKKKRLKMKKAAPVEAKRSIDGSTLVAEIRADLGA